MKLLLLAHIVALAFAASTTTMDMSGMETTMVMSSTSMAASTPSDTSPPYTITALPIVKNQTSCVFNCLIPIGLADSSGCDDVTENCACLSAPVDAESFFSTCIATVCGSSTSAYIASATSLYESYCMSVYGSASLAAATTSNVQADAAAASSTASSSSSSSATATGTKSGGALGRSVDRGLVGLSALTGLVVFALL
ncbi:hypothetical protein BDZ45DRAFT_46250 [Acephala macrosclerotiorum]|nr:hypothetical protein BDZ45DRAFT_46250 [Acephala macrosclerotiorum]